MSAQIGASRTAFLRFFHTAWIAALLLITAALPLRAQGPYLIPGVVSTVAGSTIPPYSAEPGPATSVQIVPGGIALDSAKNLFIADPTNCVVHRVDAVSGVSTVVAGISGNCSYAVDGVLATLAPLNHPQGVSVDTAGNLFIADTGSGRIRKVDVNTGLISTVAGDGTFGLPPFGVPATASPLVNPINVLVNAAGDLFIAQNYIVSKVDHLTGFITPFAGTGISGYTGDGGLATAATVNLIFGMAIDPAGNVFLADYGSNVAREVTTDGNIHTVAGNNTPGYSGDGGLATSAQLNQPYGVAVDGYGKIYIADSSNHMIREVSSTGIISRTAGYGVAGFSGDGGPALWAQFNNPQALTLNSSGDLYVSDYGNFRVRKILATQPGTKTPPQISTGTVDFGTQPAGSTSNAWTINISNTVGTALNLYSIFLTDPADFVMTTNCGSVLPAYSSCRVMVSFSPQAAVGYTGLLYIVSDASHSPQKVTLIGTGTSNLPTVIVAPTSIDFGQQGAGSTGNPWTVTLNNTSGYPLNVTGISLSDPLNFKILQNNCGVPPTVLPAHSTCTVQVAFSPVDTLPHSGTLIFTDNASTGGGTQTVSLTGTGTSSIFLSPSAIDFGTQGIFTASNAWTITVNNTTGSTITLVGPITLTNPADFHLVDNCGTTLPAHSTCTLQVTFTPQSAGLHGGSIIVQPLLGPLQQVTLTGTGTISYIHATLSPSSIDFGQINVGSASNYWTVQLSNPNGSQINIAQLFITKADHSTISPDFLLLPGTTPCGPSLPAYSSCQFKIAFAPTATGPINGFLNVGFLYTVNNTTIISGEQLSVALTGTGTQAVFFSPTSIDFGSLTTGQTGNPWTVTLNNPSGSPVNVSPLQLTNAADFTVVSNACGSTLPAYSNCNVQVAFSPHSTGVRTGTLKTTVSSTFNAAAQPYDILVSLTGNGSPIPDYSLSVNPQVVTLTAGQTGTATFTFTPVGGYQGTVYFQCTGLPAGVTCVFNPTSVTANGSNQVQTSLLTITTTAPYSGPVTVGGFALLPGIALAGLVGWRRRKIMPRLRGVLMLVAMVCILGGAMGCGAGVPSAIQPTPPGSHVVTVSASTSSSGSSSGSGSTTTTTTHTADFTIIIH